jgi:hypothetical protein
MLMLNFSTAVYKTLTVTQYSILKTAHAEFYRNWKKNLEQRTNIPFNLIKFTYSQVLNITTPTLLKDHHVKTFCMEYHQGWLRNV